MPNGKGTPAAFKPWLADAILVSKGATPARCWQLISGTALSKSTGRPGPWPLITDVGSRIKRVFPKGVDSFYKVCRTEKSKPAAFWPLVADALGPPIERGQAPRWLYIELTSWRKASSQSTKFLAIGSARSQWIAWGFIIFDVEKRGGQYLCSFAVHWEVS